MLETPMLHVDFSADGNSEQFKFEGWCRSEATYAWTASRRCTLRLPRPATRGTYLLRADLFPNATRPGFEFQRLRVEANGSTVASLVIRAAATIEIWLPDSVLAERDELELTFELPDARPPDGPAAHGDVRPLGLAFRSLDMLLLQCPEDQSVASAPAAPTAPQILLECESLGDNCEFGLIQARFGADRPGMLRYSSAPLAGLIKAIGHGFAGFGDPENVSIWVAPNGEYMTRDTLYGIEYHTWINTPDRPIEAVRTLQLRRMTYLKEKLLHDLQSGAKLFVYRSGSGAGRKEIDALAAAVRAHGPNTLLWVAIADRPEQVGCAERLGNALLKGYVDRFPKDAFSGEFSFEAWLSLCREAHALWRVA